MVFFYNEKYGQTKAGEDMHKKIFSALELLNILFQAFYTLALPIGIGALASFLLTKFLYAPSWIWAVLLILGVLIGLYSMIKYILTATAGIDRRDKQTKQTKREQEEKEAKQEWLRNAGKDIDNKYDE